MLKFFFKAAALGFIGNLAYKTFFSDDKVSYSTKDAANLLNISEYTVRKKIRDGEIKANLTSSKTGYRIEKEELENYAAKTGNKVIVDNSPEIQQENFSNTINEIEKFIEKNPNVTINLDVVQNFIDGKKLDLKGLKLRLEMLQLDYNSSDESIDFKRKKLALEIAINDLESEIKAAEIWKNSFHQ